MKIPVFCSLIPTELLASLSHELDFLDASECGFVHVPSCSCQLHENLCSYAKKLHEYFLNSHEKYDIIIVPTSCDAMKKIASALKASLPVEKVYLLDVPQNKGEAAAKYFAAELQKLKLRLEK